MSEESKEKRTLVEWINDHPKSTFITRAILWAILAGGLPFAFIAWRYGIFKDSGSIAISGWGIIGIVIAAIFVFVLAGYIRKGLKPGPFKYLANGFCKVVLPLVILLIVVEGVKRDIALFEKALIVTTVCELIAIPVNPFPEWLAKRQSEMKLEEQEGVFEAMWNKFFAKKKEAEKEE